MNHYKGKTTITELLNMPNWIFNSLYTRLIRRLSTDEGKKNAEAEKLQETLEEGLGI